MIKMHASQNKNVCSLSVNLKLKTPFAFGFDRPVSLPWQPEMMLWHDSTIHPLVDGKFHFSGNWRKFYGASVSICIYCLNFWPRVFLCLDAHKCFEWLRIQAKLETHQNQRFSWALPKRKSELFLKEGKLGLLCNTFIFNNFNNKTMNIFAFVLSCFLTIGFTAAGKRCNTRFFLSRNVTLDQSKWAWTSFLCNDSSTTPNTKRVFCLLEILPFMPWEKLAQICRKEAMWHRLQKCMILPFLAVVFLLQKRWSLEAVHKNHISFTFETALRTKRSRNWPLTKMALSLLPRAKTPR